MRSNYFLQRGILAAILIGTIGCQLSFNPTTFAQGEAIFRIRPDGGNSKISGKITGVTPHGVSIDSSSGVQEIPAAEIHKVVYANEPPEVARARDRIVSGRFDDALTDLEKISDPIKNPAIQQEIDYLRAAATAEISLRGSSVTPQDAGRMMNEFVQKNPQSYHFFPATEFLGKLFLAVGKPDLAEAEFAKLAQSKWPELVLRGQFYRGETLNELDKPAEAEAAYQTIQSTASNDDLTQTYKLLSTVRLAKSQALQGQTDAAIQAIQQVIKVENPDNAKLFAYAYNSLGSAYLKAGNLKEAAMAFLHTELLYSQESEPHAEALYQLALIWPQLDQTDRASRARETLKSRYRNSYWATKL